MVGVTPVGTRGWKRILTILIGTGFIVLFGTMGYVILEHWSLVDAFYMTIITLTTVGYSEIHTLDPPGRVFTVFLIITGVGLLAYSALVIGAFFLDGTFAGYIRRRRMERLIKKLDNHCIVCGYGRTGQEVVATLQDREVPFVVIEKEDEVIRRMEEEGLAAIHGNAHDNEPLEIAGIARAKALIACASDDAENVFITLSARSLRPDLIIASRAEDRDSEPKLRRAGANHVVTPYTIAGDRLVASIYRPSLVAFFESHVKKARGYDIREVVVGPHVKGKTFADLRIRSEYKITVLALRREDGAIIPNPDAETRLQERDVLLALGPVAQLERLSKDCEVAG
jgi:voltage-gated potassium channel